MSTPAPGAGLRRGAPGAAGLMMAGVPRIADKVLSAALLAIAFDAWRRRVHGQCHCLCGVHRADGMVCRPGRGPMVLTLTGGIASPMRVPMCGPCGSWWRERAPHRVASVVAW